MTRRRAPHRMRLAAALLLLWGLLAGPVTSGCKRLSEAARGTEASEPSIPEVLVPSAGPDFDRALFQTLGVTMRPGHRVDWRFNGEALDAVVAEVGKAKQSVSILMYVWEAGVASDRIVSAISARTKDGVSCRIVVDDVGSRGFADKVGKTLVAAGCEVRTFRPLPAGKLLERNHRKLIVVDGAVALTGGFGIRDEWTGDGIHDDKWRDTSARVAGPSVVDAQQIFADNWLETGGAFLPRDLFPISPPRGEASVAFVSSTASPNVTRAERLIRLLLGAGKKRIWIANAYFVPSRAILAQLERKAGAGVDVRILVAGKKSDSKTSFGVQQGIYGDLVKRGARIFEYEPSMMHAKTMIIDDRLSLVGSINLDPLGLHTLEEIGAVVDDGPTATALAARFEEDCGHAKAVGK